MEALLADSEIELVVNLTTPKAHLSVATQCLHAGKHVYCEKPLGIDLEEGRANSEAAFGNILPVETEIHLTGVLEFANGCLITMIMSFDTWRAEAPPIREMRG